MDYFLSKSFWVCSSIRGPNVLVFQNKKLPPPHTQPHVWAFLPTALFKKSPPLKKAAVGGFRQSSCPGQKSSTEVGAVYLLAGPPAAFTLRVRAASPGRSRIQPSGTVRTLPSALRTVFG